MTTRAEILARSRSVSRQFYSMGAFNRQGYRQDCSGFVSQAWGIPPNENGGWGGQTTVSLVTRGYMYEIPKHLILPGDAIGICGPGTAGGDGHIVLAESAYENGYYSSAEMCGGCWGPLRRRLRYPYNGGGSAWKAWRFRGIQEASAEPAKQQEEDDKMLRLTRYQDSNRKFDSRPIFLTDGVTARWVESEPELKDLWYLNQTGVQKLGNDGKIGVVTRMSLIGRIVGKVPPGFESCKA